jgi:2-oxoglutarate ferredoxin oxidoreductase subunit alpha
MKHTFAVSIGGAVGQGVATPGNIFTRIFARRGLHLNAYNAYQSIPAYSFARASPER